MATKFGLSVDLWSVSISSMVVTMSMTVNPRYDYEINELLKLEKYFEMSRDIADDNAVDNLLSDRTCDRIGDIRESLLAMAKEKPAQMRFLTEHGCFSYPLMSLISKEVMNDKKLQDSFSNENFVTEHRILSIQQTS